MTMPTIEQLREAFPHVSVGDEILLSPFYHLGVVGSYVDKDRHKVSLDVISEALREGAKVKQYVVTSKSGEHVIRTSNLEEAWRYQVILRGQVIDVLSGAIEVPA